LNWLSRKARAANHDERRTTQPSASRVKTRPATSKSRGRHPGPAGQTPTCLANRGSGHCRHWEPSVTPPSLRRDDTTFPRLRRLISIDTADGDPSSGSFLLARRAGGEKES